MDDSLIIAMLMTLGFVAFGFATEYYFFMDLTGRGWKQTCKNFPQIAQRLNLLLKGPEFGYEMGEISGIYRGYNVKIMPDRGARIQLDMGHSENLDLDTDATDGMKLKNRFQEVNFKLVELNDYLKTRFSTDEFARKLLESEEFSKFFGQFRHRWGRKVSRLRVENGFIRCSFPHGRQRYIPARYIEPVLKDLADLADILKSI